MAPKAPLNQDEGPWKTTRPPSDYGSQIRILAQSHEILVQQIAELGLGQTRLGDRQADASHRMGLMEADLKHNTSMTQEVLDVFASVKSGFRVLGWLGSAAKWLTGILVFIGTAIGIYHGVGHK